VDLNGPGAPGCSGPSRWRPAGPAAAALGRLAHRNSCRLANSHDWVDYSKANVAYYNHISTTGNPFPKLLSYSDPIG
jgi:hypothetical protein